MILLVEDNEDDVFIMERAVKKSHLAPAVQTVVDGREALDYLEGLGKYSDRAAHPIPELIFLDLKLPELHGFDVLRWIRGQQFLAQVPVLVLSSSPEERDIKLARELGAVEFLVKPPDTDTLNRVFEKYLPSERPKR